MPIDYHIRVSDRFLEDATAAALEAYCFGDGHKKTKSRIETFGLIWGYRRAMEELEIVQLDRLFICLSAKRNSSWVDRNKDAVKQMIEVIDRMSPHQHMLGFFHSHPYDSQPEVMGTDGGPGFEFSDGDFDFLLNEDLLWEASHGSPVMAVTTVCPMERVHESIAEDNVRSNVVRYNLGHYRFWLNVAVGREVNGERKCTPNKRSPVFLDLGSKFYNPARDRIAD